MLNLETGVGFNPRVYIDTDRTVLEFTQFTVADTFRAMYGSAEHDPAVQLDVQFRVHSESWQVHMLTVSSLNESITTESVRDIGIVALLNRAFHVARNVLIQTASGEGLEAFLDRERETTRALRGDGPTASNLDRVASLYRVSRLAALSASTVIQDAFDLPPRTAAHWVKLARQRGHIPEGLNE